MGLFPWGLYRHYSCVCPSVSWKVNRLSSWATRSVNAEIDSTSCRLAFDGPSFRPRLFPLGHDASVESIGVVLGSGSLPNLIW